MVKEWVLYHNMTPLKDARGTLTVWLKTVENIPSESVPWIIQQGKECDPPRNIPNLAWQLFRKWRDVHPEKAAPKRYDGPACSNPWCEDGMMHVGRNNQAGQYEVWAFRCGICRRAREAYPYATPGELVEAGYEPDRAEKAFERISEKVRDAPRRRDGSVDWRTIAASMIGGCKR